MTGLLVYFAPSDYEIFGIQNFLKSWSLIIFFTASHAQRVLKKQKISGGTKCVFTNNCKMFFKDFWFNVNSRPANIRSVHTYVLRMKYFWVINVFSTVVWP